MKRYLASALLVAATILQPGLAAAQKGAAATDNGITDLVRMRLATDADVKGAALEVTVKDGEVTIKGRVDTEKAKNKATRLAKKVKGVKNVDNELTVGPPA